MHLKLEFRRALVRRAALVVFIHFVLDTTPIGA
jgi:hypothetical protein